MGRVVSLEARQNLVSDIESIIHHPAELRSVVADARSSLTETGHLPNDMLWDYLTWRRDLDPSRFDHYHPEFLGVFTQAEYAYEHDLEHHPDNLNLANLPMPISSIPLPTVPISTPDAPGGSPGVSTNLEPFTGTVPEPSSIILMAAALIIARVWFGFPFKRPASVSHGVVPCSSQR